VSKEELTIVTRLGKEGFSEIFDLQLCLSAQVDKNFTWIILLRPSAHSLQSQLETRLEMTPELNSRTNLIKCNTDNRSKLLNKALDMVLRGYIVVFDDDDLPLSNYVKVIRDLAIKSNMQAIIRTATVQISTTRLNTYGGAFQVSSSKANFLWPMTFNRLDHMRTNLSPCMSISYPVRLLKRHELKWDEKLLAVEDWDLLMRASEQIPVQSTEVVTSIYRRPGKTYRSQLAVSAIEWNKSELVVRKKLDDLKFVLTGSEISSLINQNFKRVGRGDRARAKYYVFFVHKIRLILMNYPRTYLFSKLVHKKLIRILRIENYV
jgi:hypothetical protein